MGLEEWWARPALAAPRSSPGLRSLPFLDLPWAAFGRTTVSRGGQMGGAGRVGEQYQLACGR